MREKQFEQQIDDVCSFFGSAADLARQLGLRTHAVSNWRARGRIPAVHAIAIERLSDGAFQAKDLVA